MQTKMFDGRQHLHLPMKIRKLLQYLHLLMIRNVQINNYLSNRYVQCLFDKLNIHNKAALVIFKLQIPSNFLPSTNV